MPSPKNAIRFGCPKEEKLQDKDKNQQQQDNNNNNNNNNNNEQGYMENMKQKVETFACGKSVGDIENQVISTVQDSVNEVKDKAAGSVETLENVAGDVQAKLVGGGYHSKSSKNDGNEEQKGPSSIGINRSYSEDVRLIDKMDDSKVEDFLRDQHGSSVLAQGGSRRYS